MEEEEGATPARPTPGRAGRVVQAAAFSVGFPVAAWFFLGGVGLAVATLLVSVWWLFAPRGSWFWATSVLLLALTPAVLVAGGLTQTRVVGAGFGVEHLLAHWVVAASLMVAAFAAVTEALEGLRGRGAARPLLLRAGRALMAESQASTPPPEDPSSL